jgi:hypothetical protein
MSSRCVIKSTKSAVIRYSLIEACIRKYERKFSNITKLGMKAHRDTRTGGDAMMDLD